MLRSCARDPQGYHGDGGAGNIREVRWNKLKVTKLKLRILRLSSNLWGSQDFWNHRVIGVDQPHMATMVGSAQTTEVAASLFLALLALLFLPGDQGDFLSLKWSSILTRQPADSHGVAWTNAETGVAEKRLHDDPPTGVWYWLQALHWWKAGCLYVLS